MNKSIIAAGLIAFTVIVGGCTSTGASPTITDEAKVSTIKPGKSTTKDIEASFGRPSNVEYLEKGEQVWSYQHVAMGPLAYVPFLNMTGNSGKESSLVIRFNNKGVVKEFRQGENRL